MFEINRHFSNSMSGFDNSLEELRNGKKMFRQRGLCTGKYMKPLSPKRRLQEYACEIY